MEPDSPKPSFHERVGTQLADMRRQQGEIAATVPTPIQTMTQVQGAALAMEQLGMRRWTSRGDAYYGVADTIEQLPAGCYRAAAHEMMGPILVKMKVETDKLLELPDDAGASIIAQFQQFWTLAAEYKARGFLHKRGFLLWGPPGSGKTSQVHIMIKRLIDEMGGVVVVIDHAATAAACLQMLRKIEAQRPIIVIMEDLDALVYKYGEPEYLALLDGEAQVDNCVFLATTNYPERLDPRFVDRPSRFDIIREIGMPSAAARRVFLEAKESSLVGADLEHWVEVSEGFSIAHLKEMILAVRCFQQPIDEVVERLVEMHERKPTSEQASDKSIAGFLGGRRRHRSSAGKQIGNGALNH